MTTSKANAGHDKNNTKKGQVKTASSKGKTKRTQKDSQPSTQEINLQHNYSESHVLVIYVF
ncbi:hypothetical protein LINPERHAP1_LOCUS27855, partial [Linum perenne]